MRSKSLLALFSTISTAVVAGSPALAQTASISAVRSGAAFAAPSQAVGQAAAPASPPPVVGEIVVTAQKREQSINKVPMSITALSGQALIDRGITETADLTKVVPGFNFTETAYATPVYTIRGIGFQESSLAASPAVSVYVDEVPLPFPDETEAVALDLERVEVLKGPQGTLYGEDSTGGAVNYIAAKPTSHFTSGVDASYGRFNTTDVQGFVSGPLTDTLTARLSGRAVEASNWQQSYTDSATLGARNQLEARLLLDWRPIDKLKISTNFNISQDRSDTPAAQLIGISPQSNLVPIPTGLTNFPLTPDNDRAADWDQGRKYRRDNIFFQLTGRADYSLTNLITLSSITSYQRYTRDQPFDTDGTTYQSDFITETGSVSTIFQELRLTGRSMNRLSWIVGANYESDDTYDANLIQFTQSSISQLAGFPLTEVKNQTQQDIRTSAAYANLDYDLTSNITLHGGIRYTVANRSFAGCTQDTGNGQAATALNFLGGVLRGGAPGSVAQPGQCVTLNADFDSALVRSKLDENNIAWRTGADWRMTSNTLFYFNVSKGYKSGSFPTLSASSYVQFTPVKQESVLAYEVGTKTTLFDRKLQLNAAAFYYDYTDKQIRGEKPDPVFGNLEALVTIPRSHIDGFELSAAARPLAGLTIAPAITLVQTRIDGTFTNVNPFGVTGNFAGEPFPYTPKWSGNVDVNYERPLTSSLSWFAGGNLSYQGSTNGGFGQLPVLDVRSYALLDLRAGIANESSHWRVSLYGQNVTDQYYWVSADHAADAITRYAGMPATYGVRLSYRFD